MDKFLADVNAVYTKLGRCVIAVSEGICDTDGVVWTKKIADTSEKDAHGNIQLSGTGALADFLAGQVKNILENQTRPRRHIRLSAKKLRRPAIALSMQKRRECAADRR